MEEKLEGLRIAAARAKDALDFARSENSPLVESLMREWIEAAQRYQDALRTRI